jgi:hypothetical protein
MEQEGDKVEGELVGVPARVRFTVAIIADTVLELAVCDAHVVRFIFANGEVPS